MKKHIEKYNVIVFLFIIHGWYNLVLRNINYQCNLTTSLTFRYFQSVAICSPTSCEIMSTLDVMKNP